MHRGGEPAVLADEIDQPAQRSGFGVAGGGVDGAGGAVEDRSARPPRTSRMTCGSKSGYSRRSEAQKTMS